MSASMTQARVRGTALASTLSGAVANDQRSRIRRQAQRPTLAGSTVATIAAVLGFATAVIALPMRAAVADQERRDDRGYEERRNDRGYEPGRGHERRRGHERGREYRRYRVYAPPPVYYPEVVSPGIRLVFPIEIR